MSKRLTEEQKAANKAARMREQEKKSWQIYKEWQGENIGSVLPGQEIRSLKEFRAIYNDESVGRKISNIKEYVRYRTRYKTYKAAKEKYVKKMRDVEGWKFSKEEFNRAMSTRELAEFLRDDIYDMRRELEKAGKSKKEISATVSSYFFGS